MPKPPPVEYFEFTCRAAVLTAGPIMAQLTKMEGLEVSAPRLVSEVRAFTKNNDRTNHATKAEDFLIDWIASHPEFQAKEAIQHFRADGRTDGSGYTALRVLVGRNLLRKLGEGRYTTLAKKHQPKKAKATKVYHDIGASDFTLRLMSRNHGKISSATLKKHFEDGGRAPTGTGPVLRKLVTGKKIRSLGEGLYEMIKPKPKTNGAAAVEAAEA